MVYPGKHKDGISVMGVVYTIPDPLIWVLKGTVPGALRVIIIDIDGRSQCSVMVNGLGCSGDRGADAE